jgi:SAM-dependent methyltransferase
MARSANLETLVANQFGPQAAAYVASPVHAGGEDLKAMQAEVEARKPAAVLDLGCGGGHVSFAAAPFAGAVTAYDLSSEMLAAVAAEAERRGLANVTTRHGSAERLPFADASFDMVMSRYSAHHWGDVPTALREAYRVARPGATLVFADIVAPTTVVNDTFLQSFEMLRDPSHVRDYSQAEWQAMIAEAGFSGVQTQMRRLRIDFASWIARIRTPPVFVAAIRALQAAVSDDVRAYFEIEEDGSYTFDTAVFVARRPG